MSVRNLEKTNLNAGVDLNVRNIAVASSNGESYLKFLETFYYFS